jgi:integrase
MAVPRHLAARLRRSEVKLSLQTSNPMAAKVRSRLLSNAFDVLFEEMRKMAQVTPAMLEEPIRAYFQSCLNRSLEHTQSLPADPFVDIEDEIAGLNRSIAELRDELKRQAFRHSVVKDATTLLQQTSTANGSPDPEALQLACNAVLRAKIENARILAAQLAGHYEDSTPRDPLFAGMHATNMPPLPGEAVPEKAKPLALKEAVEFYCAFKAKHDWVPKTETDTRRVLTIAQHAIGADKPVRQVDTDDVKAVRDLIGTLPPHYAKYKKNEDLNLDAVIAGNGNGPTLSVKTQDKYFGLFKAFLHWAVDENHIDKQPGANVKVAGVAKLSPRDRRLPYSSSQLKAIFASPLYTGHKTEMIRHRPGPLVIRDGKFWTPLIALYSGMRMGEIVQLLTVDVKQEDGIWFFDVTKSEGDGKKVKTESSFRRVPIHRTLVDLGLLDVVAKAKPKGRLFPDIEPGADGYYSHNFSKWWGRYSRHVGFKAEKTAFHSFRHSFIDGLRNAKVTEAAGRAIVGHADDSVHASYGSGPSLAVLKEEIDKVTFAIDLATLKKKS